MLFCGLLTIAVLRINLRDALRTYGETLDQLKLAIVTVMAGPRPRLRDEPHRA